MEETEGFQFTCPAQSRGVDRLDSPVVTKRGQDDDVAPHGGVGDAAPSQGHLIRVMPTWDVRCKPLIERPDPSYAEGCTHMTEPIDELGPVDYLVIEFPGSKFNGEIAPALIDLVDRGIVRVLDLVLIRKGADGSFDAFELADSDQGELGDLLALETELAELLSADDVANVADALEPGSTAGLLIYENLWAAPFASAVRRSGGQLVANGRIPIQDLIGALESDTDEQEA